MGILGIIFVPNSKLLLEQCGPNAESVAAFLAMEYVLAGYTRLCFFGTTADVGDLKSGSNIGDSFHGVPVEYVGTDAPLDTLRKLLQQDVTKAVLIRGDVIPAASTLELANVYAEQPNVVVQIPQGEVELCTSPHAVSGADVAESLGVVATTLDGVKDLADAKEDVMGLFSRVMAHVSKQNPSEPVVAEVTKQRGWEWRSWALTSEQGHATAQENIQKAFGGDNKHLVESNTNGFSAMALSELRDGKLDELLFQRFETVFQRGVGEGMGIIYDVDKPEEREFVVTPAKRYIQWVPARAAKEYPNIDKPINVVPEYDPNRKYFRDFNPQQRLLRVVLPNGNVYEITTNNRPLLHTSFLIAKLCLSQPAIKLYPQVIREVLLEDLLTIQQQSGTKVMLGFNGWEAGASVNQFHIHGWDTRSLPAPSCTFLFDEKFEEWQAGIDGAVTVSTFSKDDPKTGVVFALNDKATDLKKLSATVCKFTTTLQRHNVPANVFLDPASLRVVVTMRNNADERPVRLRNCYIGCYEMFGILSVYTPEDKEEVWGSDEGMATYFKVVKYSYDEALALLKESFSC